MKTRHFLVESGTEELPPKALLPLSEAFRDGIAAGVKERDLACGAVRAFATPRRLAVLVENLQLQGADKSLEALGPPAEKSKDEQGRWTAAAEGFARKQGVQVEDLLILEAGPKQERRLACRSVKPGLRALDCLPGIVGDSLRDLPIPKRMRWGAGRTEFARPVHWVLMLLGNDVVDCELLGQRAGRATYGHRFHSSRALSVSAPEKYEAVLEKAQVIADFSRRRERVQKQVEQQARAIKGKAVIDPALLDEVTALVEWPVALSGAFDKRFLRLPAEALISSMKEHQKYFHVVNKSGALLPRFIAVANIESASPERVVDGNERVIRPRLADADFFFTQDQKQTLESKREQLERVVFQQKLGSLGDKTRRLVKLCEHLAPELGADVALARRAAELSKADLVSLLVGEFPDMQGIAGRYYVLNDGEAPEVATALEQQYWPRFAGDALPNHPVATCLALADRLDTLAGIFGIGQAPSGSKDPFSLRRASLGILRILVAGEIALDLKDCLNWAVENYPAGTLPEKDVQQQVTDYIIDRFRAWCEDEAIPVEVFRAVNALGLTTPLDIHRRVQAVHAFTHLPEAPALAEANKRVSNILVKQAALKLPELRKDLLQEAAEKTLAVGLREQEKKAGALIQSGQYTEALASLAKLRPAVDTFFDDVLVMDEDEALRNNRLRLLHDLRHLFLQAADISELALK